MEASNANEAEVFAMLVGCRELLKLDDYFSLIEGDSFSAIQWGSGKTMYPWRLTDWVEEVLDISSQLQASFLHILREANVIADGFAKEGLTRETIFFDI